MKHTSIYIFLFLIIFTIGACSHGNKLKARSENEVSEKQFKEQSIDTQPGTIDYQNIMEFFTRIRSRNSTNIDVYPDYYGGSFIDKNGKLVVYITKESIDTITNILMQLDMKNTRIKSCDYSYNSLNEIMDKLNKYQQDNSGSPIAENFTVYLLDDSKNRIIVKLTKCDAAAIKEFKANVMDSPAIEFVQLEAPYRDI